MTASLSDLASKVVQSAKASRLKIVTAESCTAGSLSTLIADSPGAGEILLGGFVVYDKLAKTELLGIPFGLIQEHTAVSEEIATAMTAGCLERSPSVDIAVAVTGVGGPLPDDDGNPVGLMVIAVQRRNAPAFAVRMQINETSSGRIRGEALAHALGMVLDCLPNDAADA